MMQLTMEDYSQNQRRMAEEFAVQKVKELELSLQPSEKSNMFDSSKYRIKPDANLVIEPGANMSDPLKITILTRTIFELEIEIAALKRDYTLRREKCDKFEIENDELCKQIGILRDCIYDLANEEDAALDQAYALMKTWEQPEQKP